MQRLQGLLRLNNRDGTEYCVENTLNIWGKMNKMMCGFIIEATEKDSYFALCIVRNGCLFDVKVGS